MHERIDHTSSTDGERPNDWRTLPDSDPRKLGLYLQELFARSVPAWRLPIIELNQTVSDLVSSLELWATRDDTKAQAVVRKAAGTAVETVDAMLRELQQLRSQLVTEIRQSDDAAAARVDALLADLSTPNGGTAVRGDESGVR
jgi:hypothetical protein